MTKKVYTLLEFENEMKKNVKKYAKKMEEEFAKRKDSINI